MSQSGKKKGQKGVGVKKKNNKNKGSVHRKAGKKCSQVYASDDLVQKLFLTMEKHREVSSCSCCIYGGVVRCFYFALPFRLAIIIYTDVLFRFENNIWQEDFPTICCYMTYFVGFYCN